MDFLVVDRTSTSEIQESRPRKAHRDADSAQDAGAAADKATAFGTGANQLGWPIVGRVGVSGWLLFGQLVG
jgi:hypothetical protein